MLNKVRNFIGKYQLLDAKKHYLVALSGGADSVCLLLLLKELGYQIEAVHCNFLLRGDESYRDENFVKELCEKKGIELHTIHFDTNTYAETHKISIEMAARELRYRYFEQLRKDIGADGICVAHHQNDSVETILINLLRGTGIHGLSGIKPRNGNILRPLLSVSKNDIEEWLQEQQQDYVTDSTNLLADVVRNKLRINVIPQLEAINASAKENILKTAQHISEAILIYDEYTNQALQRLIINNTIEIERLKQEPSPESILFQWLNPYHFPSSVIENICQSLLSPQAGREWLSQTHQLTIHQGLLILEKQQNNLPEIKIPETGTYIYTETMKIRLKNEKGKHLERSADFACLDASSVHFPLTLRPTKTGDRFLPYGMKGTKLVSDYLTDRHLSIFQKRRTLVLCDKDGQIIWLVSHRPDARFCITDATETTLIITIE